jgi:hypothetical protein
LDISIKKRQMDRDIKTKRNKKSDKAKDKFDRTGGFSQKHVRIAEALAAAGAQKAVSSRQATASSRQATAYSQHANSQGKK